MSLLVLGLNYQSAPLALREKLAFAKSELEQIIPQLIAETSITEVVFLSTCNRTEIYCVDGESNALMQWLCAYRNVNLDELARHWYVYHDAAAIRHLARVASGLDSMVLGEPQILGQVKDAYQLSQDAKGVGPHLHRLFQQCFNWAKKIRSETDIGKNAISIAFAAVGLAKHIFTNLADCHVVFLGAGETVALAARHFAEQKVKKFTFVNRTLANAENLAQQFNGSALALNELATVLDADIIVTATESAVPLITQAAMKQVIKTVDHPILLLDLAVPRNIEAAISNLPDCYLYTIDDLQALIKENLEQRQAAATLADEILAAEIEKFLQEQKSHQLSDHIKDFVSQNDALLQELLLQMQSLSKDSQVLQLVEKFSKKLQHQALQFVKDHLK